MRTRVLLVIAALAVLMGSGRWEPELQSAELASSLFGVESEICLMPPDRAAYTQTRGGGAGRELAGDKRRSGDWPPEGVAGGDIMPVRTVFDNYPTFDAVSVDPEAGRVFFTDSSLSQRARLQDGSGRPGLGHHRLREPDPRTRHRHRLHRRRRSRPGAERVLRGQQRRRRRRSVRLRADRRREAGPHVRDAAPVVGDRDQRAARRGRDHGAAAPRRRLLQARRQGHGSAAAQPARLRDGARGPARHRLRRAAQGAGDRQPRELDGAAALQSLRSADQEHAGVQAGALRAAVAARVRRQRDRQRQAAARHHRQTAPA